ncbi:MAG: nitronate monooxygenase [Mycobacterium sp.]
MTALSTRWSTSIGLTVPIVNAPMGGAAGGALAAAVSRAGGLGMIGLGSTGSVPGLETELRHLSGLGRPFGIGLVDWVVARQPALLTAALDSRPTLLAVSFGDNSGWVRRAHDEGILAAAQIADLDEARRAVDAGVDVVIARGAEAGGHGAPRIGTLPLLAEVLEELAIPVLAAGGIGSGRALAAVLAAGAAGAWIGTAFAACTEALTPEWARTVLLDAADTDTVTTRVFDVVQRYPWPAELPERVVRNGFVDRWCGLEDQLAADDDACAAQAAAAAAGDHTLAAVNAGQGVGSLRSVRGAAAVIADLTADARRLLDRW